MEGWNNYDGKKVFIILENGRRYSGVVKVDTSGDTTWFHMIDKFEMNVSFNVKEIDLIQEEKSE